MPWICAIARGVLRSSLRASTTPSGNSIPLGGLPAIATCASVSEASRKPLQRPVDRLAIMRLQHVEAHDLARPVVQHLPDRDEIPERLRHLLALDLQEAVVQPVVGHRRRAVGAARLGDLVLVVREDEVDAAAVDVERPCAEAARRPSPSTRCASRDARAPQRRSARPARRASTASTARSPSGRACRARPRRGRRRSSRRACGWRAGRSRASTARGRGRGPRRHRHGRARPAARSAGSCPRRIRPVDILGRARLDGRRQAAERRDVLVELRRRSAS